MAIQVIDAVMPHAALSFCSSFSRSSASLSPVGSIAAQSLTYRDSEILKSLTHETEAEAEGSPSRVQRRRRISSGVEMRLEERCRECLAHCSAALDTLLRSRHTPASLAATYEQFRGFHPPPPPHRPAGTGAARATGRKSKAQQANSTNPRAFSKALLAGTTQYI